MLAGVSFQSGELRIVNWAVFVLGNAIGLHAVILAADSGADSRKPWGTKQTADRLSANVGVVDIVRAGECGAMRVERAEDWHVVRLSECSNRLLGLEGRSGLARFLILRPDCVE